MSGVIGFQNAKTKNVVEWEVAAAGDAAPGQVVLPVGLPLTEFNDLRKLLQVCSNRVQR